MKAYEVPQVNDGKLRPSNANDGLAPRALADTHGHWQILTGAG